jgi:hypothetical protein
MPVKCTSCGAENPEGASYCNLCHSTVGFDDIEYGVPANKGEGFSTQYPSSFRDDAPVPPPDGSPPPPDAPPVEVGRYGVRSGGQYVEPPPGESDLTSLSPLDVGSYGTPSGHELSEPAPTEDGEGRGGKSSRRGRRRRR